MISSRSRRTTRRTRRYSLGPAPEAERSHRLVGTERGRAPSDEALELRAVARRRPRRELDHAPVRGSTTRRPPLDSRRRGPLLQRAAAPRSAGSRTARTYFVELRRRRRPRSRSRTTTRTTVTSRASATRRPDELSPAPGTDHSIVRAQRVAAAGPASPDAATSSLPPSTPSSAASPSPPRTPTTSPPSASRGGVPAPCPSTSVAPSPSLTAHTTRAIGDFVDGQRGQRRPRDRSRRSASPRRTSSRTSASRAPCRSAVPQHSRPARGRACRQHRLTTGAIGHGRDRRPPNGNIEVLANSDDPRSSPSPPASRRRRRSAAVARWRWIVLNLTTLGDPRSTPASTAAHAGNNVTSAPPTSPVDRSSSRSASASPAPSASAPRSA